MTPTADTFAFTMQEYGYRVAVVDSTDEHGQVVSVGVNVWRDPLATYPADTVWFSSNDAHPIRWGPAFEYAYTGDEADELATEVIETVKPQPWPDATSD